MRNKFSIYLILNLLFLGTTECALAISPELSYSATPVKINTGITYQNDVYRLGPDDVLSIHVVNEPEYSQTNVLVRPDGNITLAGAGEINVNNETVEGARRKIFEALNKILVEPVVSVSVSTTRPAKIYLTGAVQNPGSFEFSTNSQDPNMHVQSENPQVRTGLYLTNILSNAGGVSFNADLEHVQVKHNDTNLNETVNLLKLLKDGAVDQDVVLHSGDSINVPKKLSSIMDDHEQELLLKSSFGPKSIPVRVLGRVKNPGVYELNARSPYLNTVVAMAGGFTEEANQHKVAIRRFSDENHFSTLYLSPNKYDLSLRPNDVVYIAESGAERTGRFMALAAKVLSPFQSAAMIAGYGAQAIGYGGWKNHLGSSSKSTSK